MVLAMLGVVYSGGFSGKRHLKPSPHPFSGPLSLPKQRLEQLRNRGRETQAEKHRKHMPRLRAGGMRVAAAASASEEASTGASVAPASLASTGSVCHIPSASLLQQTTSFATTSTRAPQFSLTPVHCTCHLASDAALPLPRSQCPCCRATNPEAQSFPW